MLLINGKAMLKIGNRYIAPGEDFEAPEGLAEKLKKAGLAKATAEPKENAMMPKHVGGGYYDVNGKRVKGKKAAEEVMKAGD